MSKSHLILNRYETVTGDAFAKGDIVEVHVSFVVFPANKHSFRFVPVLRGLTLLDQTFREVGDMFQYLHFD